MEMAAKPKANKFDGYCVTFDVKPDPDNYISRRSEDNGAVFRRFQVQLGSPLDKRIFIRSVFNGPTDPNFAGFIAEMRRGLHQMEDEAENGVVADSECSKSKSDYEKQPS